MIHRTMKYSLYGLKLELLISYFKEGSIDLAPAFQRGRVWTLKMRRSLLKNILQAKPVPAIFLYKQPEGAKNSFVILDGKQRLESILLFVGDQREHFAVPAWRQYFSTDAEKRQGNFSVDPKNASMALQSLPDADVIKFRDYNIPIIEIDFDDDTTLDELIQLFVDINVHGVKVKRFEIVKALYYKDPFLSQIFKLIAIKINRKSDTIYKSKKRAFRRVLLRIESIARSESPISKVDAMWERLVELALFVQTGDHRKPVEILKSFVARKTNKKTTQKKLSAADLGLLTKSFQGLDSLYAIGDISKTRWATDQTHFYILATFVINALRERKLMPFTDLAIKLEKLEKFMTSEDYTGIDHTLVEKIKKYKTSSQKQTTDVNRRKARATLFKEIIAEI